MPLKMQEGRGVGARGIKCIRITHSLEEKEGCKDEERT